MKRILKFITRITGVTLFVITLIIFNILPFGQATPYVVATYQANTYDELGEKIDDLNIRIDTLSTSLTSGLMDQNSLQDNLDKLITEVSKVAKSRGGQTGVSFIDLTSDVAFDINGDKVFVAASTIKVPLVLTVYDLIDRGKLSESTMIEYQPSDYEGGTGILQNQNYNKAFDVETLCKYAIIYSDNIATNMLIRTIGYTEFKYMLDEYTNTTYDHSGNYISANGSALVLKRLYDEKDFNPYYAKIIDWLTNTVFHTKLDKNFEYAKVAHKIGNYDNYSHDIGIFLFETPYILTVYTSNTNDADSLIADISDVVYSHVVKSD